MIIRYTPELIGSIFTDQAKFQSWLDVELAFVKIRCERGDYPEDIYPRMVVQAKFDVNEIIELDKKIEHDMLAFIENVRSYMDEDLRKYFHKGLTSYDIEVPAQSIVLQRAEEIILTDLNSLVMAVRMQASRHMWTYRMGMSHGKDGKPSTFGWLLNSTALTGFELGQKNLQECFKQTRLAKCSGAMGNYMTITPELEEAVLSELGLIPRASTQINMRDVLANLLSQIATIGGVMEKLAIDLRLMATSRFEEVCEPRRKEQKGSSAMPHKKNPIILERVTGMSSLLRCYDQAMKENIKTWLERDIAQSSVERIAMVDSLVLFDYMLQKMTWIMNNLVVDRENMIRNIDASYGIWASEDVKLMLCDMDFDTDEVYIFVQQCAFTALEDRVSFKTVLQTTVFPPANKQFIDVVDLKKLDECFDYVSKLVNLKKMYERSNLDFEIALEPNC
ncbi:MAG: lyase family protein [Candidatus Kerfeldbacteria bacterium]